MTGSKYIELDSTYRDRSLYPLPSQFIVNINQTGLKDKLSSTDPVCDSTPLEVFTNRFNSSTTDSFITGGISSSTASGATIGVGNTTSPMEVILNISNHSQIDDYYVGAILLVSNTCLLYTSPSPRDRQKSRMPSSA